VDALNRWFIRLQRFDQQVRISVIVSVEFTGW
jgi:hypothetical protein